MNGPTETDAPAASAPAVQPTASYFAAAGCALALALALLDPDSSAGLGFAPRLAYWLTHVGGALVLLVALQRLLIPATPQLISLNEQQKEDAYQLRVSRQFCSGSYSAYFMDLQFHKQQQR